jgi:hypothetical protein
LPVGREEDLMATSLLSVSAVKLSPDDLAAGKLSQQL